MGRIKNNLAVVRKGRGNLAGIFHWNAFWAKRPVARAMRRCKSYASVPLLPQLNDFKIGPATVILKLHRH